MGTLWAEVRTMKLKLLLSKCDVILRKKTSDAHNTSSKNNLNPMQSC